MTHNFLTTKTLGMDEAKELLETRATLLAHNGETPHQGKQMKLYWNPDEGLFFGVVHHNPEKKRAQVNRYPAFEPALEFYNSI